VFFVDVDIMTTDQLKEVLGNYKWTLLVALIMFAMVGFGYKLARIIDEGDSKKVQAQLLLFCLKKIMCLLPK